MKRSRLAVFVVSSIFAFKCCAETTTTTTTTTPRTVSLEGLKVSISEPVRVAESKGYLWFPTLVRVDDRRWLAVMSDKADAHTDEQTAQVAWSDDAGLTWGPLQKIPVYSECPVNVADGLVLLPNYLFPQLGGAIGGAYMFCPRGKSELAHVKQPPVTVTGWPRELDRLGAVYGHPELHIAGFVFNGQSVALKDGRRLTTLYGHFKGTKRYALVAAASGDARKWDYLSTVADETCKLAGKEGPCEAALCRLKDGRLMCVFRMEGGVPYGRSFSGDEGKTWTEPDALPAKSVQPSLAVMPDGLVALSGGRPGVNVWFNVDGDGKRWQPVEILPANAHTSAYTEIVPADEHSFLCIYDQIPNDWKPIPQGSRDVNSVWVVKLTVERRSGR